MRLRSAPVVSTLEPRMIAYPGIWIHDTDQYSTVTFVRTCAGDIAALYLADLERSPTRASG